MTEQLHSMRSWTGVRYAHAARFRAPVPVPFDPTAPMLRPGVAPYQDDPPWMDLDAPVSEDCLTLSVWAPPASETLKPIVVQLYGGGFEHGSNTSWASDGARLAAVADVVVVAPNYRVGAFGFLSLAQLGGPFAEASNLGLKDVVAAIEYVREHAVHFGGDPTDITVLGESAGGFLTAALAAIPAVRGHIRRFGVFSAGASRLVPRATAEGMADRFLTAIGLSDHPGRLLDVHADRILGAQREVIGTDIGRRNGPTPEALGIVLDSDLDTGVLEQHPAAAVDAGSVRHAELLVSALADEIAAFRAVDPDAFRPASVQALIGEVQQFGVPAVRAMDIVDQYRAHAIELGDAREHLLTDYIYRLPVARLAMAHHRAGGTAHLLLLGGVDGAPAVHGDDVAALVGQSLPGASDAARRRDTAITRIVSTFVRGESLPWAPVGDEPTAHGIGTLEPDATGQYGAVLRTWDGVPRP